MLATSTSNFQQSATASSETNVTLLVASPNRLTMEAGQSAQLAVSAIPTSLGISGVTWSSLNPYVAGVTPEGIVTAYHSGIVSIQATDGVSGKSTYATIAVSERNVMEQAAFDTDLQAWTVYHSSGYAAAQVSLDTTNKRMGSSSLKVASSAEAYTSLSQEAVIQENTAYLLSEWLKTSNVAASGNGAVIQYSFYDSANQRIGPFYYVGARSGTTDWEHIREIVHAPAGAVKLKVANLLMKASGTAWFDQLVIKPALMSNVQAQHPRLLATSQDFNRIKNKLQAQEEPYNSWFNDSSKGILKQANDTAENGVTSNLRIIEDRMKLLGMAYRISGNTNYADAAWEQLSHTMSTSASWEQDDFLDAGEATAGFAIAYDWFHDYWTSSQKEAISSEIVNKGFQAALKYYRNDPTPGLKKWNKDTNNWNHVINGSMIMAAIALADEEPEICEEILQYALFHSLHNGMHSFANDGAWGEGAGYWNYATQYLAGAMSSMKIVFGQYFGLKNIAGLSTTGDYAIQMTAPQSLFTFADAEMDWKYSYSPQLFYFGKLYGKSEDYVWYNLQNPFKKDPLDMVWLDSEVEIIEPSLSLDSHFQGGYADLVTMRSNWMNSSGKIDTEALFVGFKGGNHVLASHHDLDYGSFVLHALGERFAVDLGKELYSKKNYFQYSAQGRFSYYRKRPEGHNTLLINPNPSPSNEAPGQNIEGYNPIVRTGLHDDEQLPFAIADLSNAYSGYGTSEVRRGIRLLENRSQVLLQDEMTVTSSGSEIYWFMHTPSTNIVLGNEGKEATITINGKRLWLKILEGAGSFEVREAVRLPIAMPAAESDSPNPSIRKLVIHLENVPAGPLRIPVLMVPLALGQTAPAVSPQVTDLDGWGNQTISLMNAGFEDGWMNGWSNVSGSVAAYVESYPDAFEGEYHATHWSNESYEASTVQHVSDLPNGLYSLTAWVKSSGGQLEAYMEAGDYGGGIMRAPITASNVWKKIAINNIPVTNGQLKITFFSNANSGNWMYMDHVVLSRV
jgi:hypothetical protein